MIIEALLLLAAPIPAEVIETPFLIEPVAPCAVIEWHAADDAQRNPNYCTIPAVPSWPLDDAGIPEPLAFHECLAAGDRVFSVQEDSRRFCVGSTYSAPCFRDPITVLWWDNKMWGGTPLLSCDDVVETLVPRSECDNDCRSIPFGNGRLWLERAW